MPAKIRLRRMGRKKQPSFRIVVIDSRRPNTGDYIDQIGFYNPRTEPAELRLDLDKADEWLGNGAQTSDTAASLIRKARKGGDDSVALLVAEPAAEPETAEVEEAEPAAASEEETPAEAEPEQAEVPEEAHPAAEAEAAEEEPEAPEAEAEGGEEEPEAPEAEAAEEDDAEAEEAEAPKQG